MWLKASNGVCLKKAFCKMYLTQSGVIQIAGMIFQRCFSEDMIKMRLI